MAGGAEAPESWALLFGARRGALRERSLALLVLEGPGTASPGSSWAACWPVLDGAGRDGGWLGPSLRAAVEGTGCSSSTLSSPVLLEGCGICAWEAAAPRAAARLPSCPVAAREASGPGTRCTSPLHAYAACRTSRCTKLAVWLRREPNSHKVSAPPFRPNKHRPEMTRRCAAAAALWSAPKSCPSSWRSQGSRGRSTAGGWREMGTAGGSCAGAAWRGAVLALSCCPTTTS